MVRFATVAAVLALMAAPLVAQESTEQLRKELESLRKEVDGLKADRAQYESKEVAGAAKVSKDGMAPDGDSPVMTALKGTKLSGFVDAGYVINFNGLHSTGSSGNTDANAGAVRAFDTLDNSFYLNAIQLNIENLATKDRIVGYHIELAGGHDPSIYDGSTVSIQEGWVQIMAPIGDGLDIRVGKMATLVGYEVIESPLNNQYSRGLLFTKLENFTQTGVRAGYTLNDKMSFTLGFSNGLNSTAGGASVYSDPDHGKMAEIQFALKPNADAFVNLTVLVGNEQTAFAATSADKFYIFDITGGYTMDKLVLGLNIDIDSFQVTGGRAPGTGVAVYSKYNMSDTFAPSVRIEYFSDKNGNLGVDDGTGGAGARVFEFTLTGEFKIASTAIFRVELRHDNCNDHIFGRDGSSAKGITTLGFEAILPF